LHSIIPTNKSLVKCRFGRINFINTLIIDYPLLNKYNFDSVLEASPSQLNQALRESQIDIAPISSFEFLSHKEIYKRLTNLSISSKDYADSVLFAVNNLENLQVINITDKSASSVNLLKIILVKKYGYKLEDLQFKVFNQNSDFDNKLLIGDEALNLNRAQYKVVLDLGHEWFEMTGLPMVFGLWCSRQGFESSFVNEILLEAKQKGLNEEFPNIIIEAYARTGLDKATLCKYFNNLDYSFDSAHQQALDLYESLCRELNVI